MRLARRTDITHRALLAAGWTQATSGYERLFPIVDGNEAVVLALEEGDEDDPNPQLFVTQDRGTQFHDVLLRLSCGRFTSMESLERLIVGLQGDPGPTV